MTSLRTIDGPTFVDAFWTGSPGCAGATRRARCGCPRGAEASIQSAFENYTSGEGGSLKGTVRVMVRFDDGARVSGVLLIVTDTLARRCSLR